MPTFFFHTEDGERLQDGEGSQLPDVEAAKDAAVQILVEALRGASNRFWETESFRVVVADERGLTLFSLQMSATLAAAMGGHRGTGK
jgi:hypothetical protein